MKQADPSHPDLEAELLQAVKILRQGGVIALPTETYYGLAVDPENEEALQKLFSIKKRPIEKPILLLISHKNQLRKYATTVPDQYQDLMSRFWPGGLTLIFPAHEYVSPLVTANSGTVGIRHTSNPIAQKLITMYGAPLTATSANISEQDPAKSAAEVEKQLGSDLDFIIDGGIATSELPSTIVDYRNDRLCIARHGVVSLDDEIEDCN